MVKELDIDNWERKEHFHFYKNFDEPFFEVTVDIDCTIAFEQCKEQDYSFFLYYLHKSLQAVNNLEAFKYRIVGEQVVVFDKVNASPTINRPNGTFGFAYMDYFEDYKEFEKTAKQEIERIQKTSGLRPALSGENVIHYSSLPWVKFTALSHARNFAFKDSCPKISFGKMTHNKNKKEMPVSIHVHHALMDGFHVGQYIDTFQTLMNK